MYRVRPFARQHLKPCLSVFAANVPNYFDPSERQAYRAFLEEEPEHYFVIFDGENLVGCFGLSDAVEKYSGRISWIMSLPARHGSGIGSFMMQQILGSAKERGLRQISIAASHLSKPFFAKFGAQEITFLKDGWGPDMHRVDMSLAINHEKTY